MAGPLRSSMLLACACALVASCTGAAPSAEGRDASAPADRDYWPTEAWRTADPAEHGLDAAEIELLGQTLADDYPTVRSMVVVRDGYLVHEYYGPGLDATDGHDVRSVTKSVVGILVGAALDDGALDSLEQTVAELLPDHVPAGSDLGAVTVRQLLTMTAGLEGDDPSVGGDLAVFDAMWESPDWVRHILGRQLDAEPGASWAYSSASSHLLSAIVAESTGGSTLDHARRRLFDPLGIRTDGAFEPVLGAELDQEVIDRFDRSTAAWPVDPQGYHYGGALLRLPARDLAKLGLLYLGEGEWDGRQLVPAEWVRESTTAQTRTTADADYGLHWWVDTVDDRPAYFARGYGGQVVHVVPELDLVTVVTADPTALIPASSLGLVTQVVVRAVAD